MSEIGKTIRDPDFEFETKIFYEEVCVDNLSFKFIITSLVEFVDEEIFNEDNVYLREIDKSVVNKFKNLIDLAKIFIKKDARSTETEDARIEAWKLHDSLPQNSTARDIAELVVLCLYDRESAEYETFGSEPMIESIMTSLARLGSGFCKKYRYLVKYNLER